MKRTEFVAFREEKQIVQKIDALAEQQGCDRSDWVRAAVREKLAKTKQ